MTPELAAQIAKRNATHILGIDESGTGAWAGPFYLAGVFAPVGWNMQGVRDSKKTTKAHRQKIALAIDDDVSIIHIEEPATVPQLEKYGHKVAYRMAFETVVERVSRYTAVSKKNILVVMDGSRNKNLQSIMNHLGFLNTMFLEKADVHVPHVSAASIFAKFNRDCEMNLLDKKFPKYYFNQHQGYGTILHRAKIAELGWLPGVHRPLNLNK